MNLQPKTRFSESRGNAVFASENKIVVTKGLEPSLLHARRVNEGLCSWPARANGALSVRLAMACLMGARMPVNELSSGCRIRDSKRSQRTTKCASAKRVRASTRIICPRCEGQKYDKQHCGLCGNLGYLPSTDETGQRAAYSSPCRKKMHTLTSEGRSVNPGRHRASMRSRVSRLEVESKHDFLIVRPNFKGKSGRNPKTEGTG